jgi:long-chain acyl-CoA synthetase
MQPNPNEVEAVASTFPGVAECACVGVPDAKSGEALSLFVVELPGGRLSEEGLIAYCRTSLTAYKVPKIVHLVDALPKSTVGKILRRELQPAPAQETPEGNLTPARLTIPGLART